MAAFFSAAQPVHSVTSVAASASVAAEGLLQWVQPGHLTIFFK
jgi:hypothetical protein